MVKHFFKRSFFFLIIVTFFSCDKNEGGPFFIKSHFVGNYPDKEVNLTTRLGNSVLLADGSDTIHLTITYNPILETNTIIDTPKKDTLFSGKVYKYKSLYYFYRKVNNGSYWISAVKIKKNYIQGLGNEFWQMYMIDQELDSNKTSLLQSLIFSDKPYALKIDQKILSSYFKTIIDSFPPMYRIHPGDSEKKSDELNEEDAQESFEVNPIQDQKLISTYYPNPVEDQLTVETNYTSDFQMLVRNEKNELILKDSFMGNKKSIGFQGIQSGVYFMEISSEKLKKSESVKLVVN